MVKKHNLSRRILLVVLCILTIFGVVALPVAASDFTPPGDFVPDYLVSQAAVQSFSFWHSDDPTYRIAFDWPGFFDGGYGSLMSDQVEDSVGSGTTIVYNNIQRVYGYPGPTTFITYDFRVLWGELFNRMLVNGGSFIAHPFDQSYNAPYAGNWTPYIQMPASGTCQVTATVRTWQKYVYSSDFVDGTWDGVEYNTRDITFVTRVDNGAAVLAPSFEQLVNNGVYNSIVYVDNGRVVASSPQTSGASAYVEILSYTCDFSFDTDINTIGNVFFHVSDMLVPAGNIDHPDPPSALNDGLSFSDVKIEIGSFLRDSLDAFLEFEIMPNFTLNDLFWLLVGIVLVLAMVFVFRR